MSPDLLALAEPLLVFGLLVVFMHWQFRELRQRAEARARAAQVEAGRDPGSPDPGLATPGPGDRQADLRGVGGSEDPARHSPG